MFKLVDSDKSLSGLKLSGSTPFHSLVSAYTNTDSISYDTNFSQSLQADTQALQEYISLIGEGKSHQDAMMLSMAGASQQAVAFAQSFDGVSASVLASGNYTEEFATKQRMAEVSTIATDKSLRNCSSIINEYNAGCKNVELEQGQFVDAVGSSNRVLGNYISGLDGAEASLGGYIGRLVGAKVQTIALRAASMALNMAISMGVSFAIQGLIKLADQLIVTQKEAIEAGEQAAQSISNIQSEYSDKVSLVSDKTERFAQLLRGVSKDGENLSLSTEDYNEFLNISNQLAEAFPSLTRTYDENGNAIVRLNGDAQTITETLKELLETERQIANQEIIDNLPDLYSGKVAKKNQYEKQLDKLKSEYKKTKDYLSAINLNSGIKLGSGNSYDLSGLSRKDRQTIIDEWGRLGLETNYDGTNTATIVIKDNSHNRDIVNNLDSKNAFGGANFKRLKNNYLSQISSLEKEMGSVRNQMKQNWSEFIGSMTTWVSTENLYQELSNQEKDAVNHIFENLDFDSLSQYKDLEEIKDFILNDIIGTVSGENKNAIVSYIDFQTRFNNNELTVGEFSSEVEKIKNVISSLDDEELQKQLTYALQVDDFTEKYQNIIDTYKELRGIEDKEGNSGAQTIIGNNPFLNNTKQQTVAEQNFLKAQKDSSKSLYSDFESWVKTLSMSELDIVADLQINTDTATWDLDEWKEKVQGQTTIKAALDFNAETATEEFENLQKVIQESRTGNNGLTTSSQSIVTSIFGDDPELFDRTASGIKLNTDRLKELQKEQEDVQKQRFDDAITELYKEYNELTDKMAACGDTASEEYEQLVESRNKIVDKINSVSDLKSEYEGLTSAYAEWQNALSNGEEGDMYDSIRTEYDKAKELYEKGLVGTSEFESYMKLLTGKDWSTSSFDEITKAWQNLGKEIGNTGYSIKDFLAEDEEGVSNFLKAASKIEGSGITEKDGFFSVAVDDTEELAKKLGVSTDLVESMFKKLKDYKFDVDFKSDTAELEKLTTGAQAASDKLRELGLTDVNFDFNTSDTQKLTDQITEAKKLYDSLKGEDGKINMNADGAEEIVMVYERLLYQKHQLESPIIMDVDTSKISDKDLAKDLESLKKIVSLHNKIEVKAELGENTSELEKELSKQIQDAGKDNQILVGMDINENTTYEDIQNKIDEWSKDSKNAQILLNAGVDGTRLDEEADKVREYIQSAVNGIEIKLEFDNKYLNNLFGGTIKLNADTSEADSAIDDTKQNVDNLKSQVETPANVKLGVDKTQAEKDFLAVNQEKQQTAQPVTVPVNTNPANAVGGLTLVEGLKTQVGQPVTTTVSADTASASSKLDNILSKLRSIASDWLSKLGGSGARGTTHRGKGLARASGDYGARRTETALIGEIAPELWVHADEGTWELVENPQFRKVKKGDIIFDGSQTAELLKKGFIDSYGRAFLSGTAYARVGGGGTLPTKPTTTTNTTTSQAYHATQSSGDVQKTSDETKSVFDNFKDWLAKLFDWVEIKIDRQAAKIDKYISKAEMYVSRATSKSYDKAGSNYISAIVATSTQIQNQNNAAQIYRAQANKILTSAKNNGLINNDAMKSIISGVENGRLVISEYSEKLQEIIKQYKTWVDKSKDASKAIVDLQSKLISYVKTLKDVRDSQRDITIDKNSFKENVGSSTYTSSSGGYYGVANEQLKYERSVLTSNYAAYTNSVTNVNNDLVKIRSYSTNTKGTGVIDKLLTKKNAKKLSKKVKTALQNAKKAMNAKKKVADSDMNVIKGYSVSLFEKIYSYNLALDNLDLARQEQALNFAESSAEIYEKIAESYENIRNAKQNSIDINKQKADAANSASEKNSLLTNNIGLYNEMLANDSAEVKRYSDLVSKQQTNLVSTVYKNIRAYGYKNLSTKGKANVDDLIKKIKDKAKKGHGIPADLLAKAADYYSKGYITKGFYESCIAYNNALEHKREAEAQQEINKATIKAEKEATGTEMFENIEKEYENKLDANQRTTQKIESQKSLTEAKRGDIDEDTYKSLINQSKEREGIYLDEITDLRNQIQTNLSTGIWDESSQAYQDALQKISDYEKDLVECQVNQEELKVSLRDDVYWRTFERAHDAAKRLSDVLSGINSLVSDDMLFDSDGNMTEFGLVRLSTLTKQYDAAQRSVNDYIKDINHLNELYADGQYTEREYTEKLGELEESLLSESSTMKSVINDILEYYKTLEQKELDGLNKIIDARKKALDAKKEYYDYDKTLKSKNKDIQFLRAQLSALEGIEDMSARAKRAQLQAQLTEAEDDLNDTIQQHQFELSSQALDGLKETMQEAFDDRWDDIGSDFETIQGLLNDANVIAASQSSAIAESLGKILSFYGINSDAQEALNTTIANKGYATGVKNIKRDETAWTQEGGKREFIIRKSDGSILTPLKSGDSVIPSKLTENLFGCGQISPDILSGYLDSSRPALNIKQPNIQVDTHYDALLNIEGNVDSTVVTDVKKFAQQFYEGAYEYTKKEIVRDARKLGVK